MNKGIDNETEDFINSDILKKSESHLVTKSRLKGYLYGFGVL